MQQPTTNSHQATTNNQVRQSPFVKKKAKLPALNSRSRCPTVLVPGGKDMPGPDPKNMPHVARKTPTSKSGGILGNFALSGPAAFCLFSMV